MLQLDGEIDIADLHSVRYTELGRGEVEQRLDASPDGCIGAVLSGDCRNGEHGDFDIRVCDDRCDLGHRVDPHPLRVRANLLSVRVERGGELEVVFAESGVPEQGESQVPRADESRSAGDMDAEDDVQLAAKVGDIVALAARAELTEPCEIAPDLRCGIRRVAGETGGRDRLSTG